MVALESRQGRQFQRYTSDGGRIVVGCIPYRLKMENSCADNIDQEVEVLVISSQKGHGMMFPKGGWEIDETIEEAASREALEEAGVKGHVEEKLGEWMYKSRSNGTMYKGILFPLIVTEELVQWPEMKARERRWVSVAEVMEGCEHFWMKEALERLVQWLSNSSRRETTSPSIFHSHLTTEKALMEGCEHLWMKEALERLVQWLSNSSKREITWQSISHSPLTTEKALMYLWMELTFRQPVLEPVSLEAMGIQLTHVEIKSCICLSLQREDVNMNIIIWQIVLS